MRRLEEGRLAVVMLGASQLRIVVVNDDPQTLEVIASWLRAHGHRVFTVSLSDLGHAYDGMKAFMSKHDPHVLVFDVPAPHGSSIDFLAALRCGGVVRVPVVLTTPNRNAFGHIALPGTPAVEIVRSTGNLDELLRRIEDAVK